MALRDNLKRIREQHGISGKEFAQKLGLKYSTYMTYETMNQQKSRWPNEETLLKIASVLGVSVDDLLGYSVPRMDEYERIKVWLESYDYGIEENMGEVTVFYQDPDSDRVKFCDSTKNKFEAISFSSKESFCQAIHGALKRAEYNIEREKIRSVFAMLEYKYMFSD